MSEAEWQAFMDDLAIPLDGPATITWPVDERAELLAALRKRGITRRYDGLTDGELRRLISDIDAARAIEVPDGVVIRRHVPGERVNHSLFARRALNRLFERIYARQPLAKYNYRLLNWELSKERPIEKNWLTPRQQKQFFE